MPQYLVIRVAEIPQLGQAVSGLVGRVTATTPAEAIKLVAQQLKEDRTDAVFGITDVTNIARFTTRPVAPPDWTVTPG